MKALRRVFALVPDCHWRTPFNFSYLNWQRHIYDALPPHVETLVIPHELDFSWARQGNLDPAAMEKERVRTSEQLWRSIQAAQAKHGLDAIISYCFAADLKLDVVRDAIKIGIPWINFFCDSLHMFDRLEPLARVVSLNWFPESPATASYQALGVPYLCAPYAFHPGWLPDLTNRQAIREAVFVGQPTTNRITQLGWLRVFGCPVDIRGKGWTGDKTPFYSPIPARKRLLKVFNANLGEKILRRLLWPLVKPRAGGPLGDQEFFDYLKDSLVVLGLNQALDAQGRLISYMKFRDMEFPGHGCCYLTEANEDIDKVFENGKEVLTFKSLAEAADHIKRVRRQPELARHIGAAGRRRVLDEHNWGIRLKQLAQRL
ncbi:MAG: glycosyltransferase [Verrucomicrobiota bacterium]